MESLQAIKNEMERRELNVTDLAIMADLSWWKVYHTLKGHSSSQEVVTKLSKVLGIKER